jgi:hypothetical protein
MPQVLGSGSGLRSSLLLVLQGCNVEGCQVVLIQQLMLTVPAPQGGPEPPWAESLVAAGNMRGCRRNCAQGLHSDAAYIRESCLGKHRLLHSRQPLGLYDELCCKTMSLPMCKGCFAAGCCGNFLGDELCTHVTRLTTLSMQDICPCSKRHKLI